MKSLTVAIATGVSASICLCLLGCGHQSTDLPANAPLIGSPRLASIIPEVRPIYCLYLPLCNRGPGDLKAQVQVRGNKQEVLYPISGFGAEAGSGFDIIVCEVPKRRLHPVYVRVIWQRGASSGVENFVVGPKQDNTVTVEPKQTDAAS